MRSIYPKISIKSVDASFGFATYVESGLRIKLKSDGKWYILNLSSRRQFSEEPSAKELLDAVNEFHSFVYKILIAGDITSRTPGLETDNLFISPLSGLPIEEYDRVGLPEEIGGVEFSGPLFNDKSFNAHVMSNTGLLAKDPISIANDKRNKASGIENCIPSEKKCYHPPDRLIWRGKDKPLRCSACQELVWMDDKGQVFDIEKESVPPWSEDDIVPNHEV